MSRPIVIDLFAGVGGLSLGFEQAGFDVKAAIEIDPIHACSHHFNFPDTVIIPHSVSELTGDDIRRAAGISTEVIDVVCGGAPCQGFSLIGKRILDDPRNHLVRDFLRIVCELDARAFVFENVKGLTLGKHKKFLSELIQSFTDAGYNVVEAPRVLNAAEYGVPQKRERLFLYGVKRDEKLPLYPLPTHQVKASKQSNLPSTPTVFQAIADLPDAEIFDELCADDRVDFKRLDIQSDYANAMHMDGELNLHFGYVRRYNRNLLTSSARTNHSDISRGRFSQTIAGTVEPISRFLKLDPHGLSNTLRAGTDASRGGLY